MLPILQSYFNRLNIIGNKIPPYIFKIYALASLHDTLPLLFMSSLWERRLYPRGVYKTLVWSDRITDDGPLSLWNRPSFLLLKQHVVVG
jgi:hypothetical protein